MKTPKGEINDKILELVKDEAMTAKMAECKNEQECYDLVKDRIDINFDEFKASMEIAKSYLNESESGLLNEEELDQVAGGKSTDSLAYVSAGLEVTSAVVSAAATAA